jgi:hypothetical protein
MTVTAFFNRVFDVFSRREGGSSEFVHDIPESFRKRVLLWLADVFGNTRTSFNSAWTGGFGPGDYQNQFWDEIHRFLQFRHGDFTLTRHSHSRAEDASSFLLQCTGHEFLDFIEYIFRVDCFFHVQMPVKQVVAELNQLLREDDLPYHVTELIDEEVREIATEHPFAGHEVTTIKTIAYPQVIMRSSEVMHVQAIGPTLTLLRRPEFRNANAEFLEALEDLRKSDFDDCLTKCGSAYESVMKVLCKQNRWPYKETDTASTLVKLMVERLKLATYHEQMLMTVPILRNRLSRSHGGGSVERQVSRSSAEFGVNSAASAILFLVQKETEA